MTREEFSDLVYDELCDDSDNCRANRIIDAANDYAYDVLHPYAFCGTTPITMKEALIAKERGDISKWISVKERLPTDDGEYLATVKGYGSDKPYVTMLCYANEFTEIMSLDTGCNSGWYRYSSEWGYYACDRVVAWRELPNAYEGE